MFVPGIRHGSVAISVITMRSASTTCVSPSLVSPCDEQNVVVALELRYLFRYVSRMKENVARAEREKALYKAD